jgi:hypothetical protein
MADEFGQTAVKLSQGPLGIIALFIVLIHGFASLVLGFAVDIGDGNRSVLVWFLVLFPVGVFLVFAWLVSCHHQKLYPPQAFRQEEHFVHLAYGRASFDKQVSGSVFSRRPAAAGSTLNAQATGNLYWLGHDLMWTADTILRQGPPEHVRIGIDQALHHLVHVGLGRTPIEEKLRSLRDVVRASDELSPSLRDEYARQIGSLIDQIGATAESAQADFQVPPHWQRVRG